MKTLSLFKTHCLDFFFFPLGISLNSFSPWKSLVFFPGLCRLPPIPLDPDGLEVPRVDAQSNPEPLSPLRGSPARCPPGHLAILPRREAVLDHPQGHSISQDAAVKFSV